MQGVGCKGLSSAGLPIREDCCVVALEHGHDCRLGRRLVDSFLADLRAVHVIEGERVLVGEAGVPLHIEYLLVLVDGHAHVLEQDDFFAHVLLADVGNVHH